MYRKNASGAGKEEQLTTGNTTKVALDWSKDGKFILFRELTAGTGRDLMAVPLDGDRKPFAVVNTTFQESNGAISPDSRWVAYLTNDSGRYELYVQAFPGVKDAPAGRWQISSGGAQEVRWRNDGREIYYESPDGKVMAAELQLGPQGVRVETPRALFSASFGAATVHEFDTTPDGQKFLVIADPRLDSSANRPTVIANWQATVEKLGPR